MTELPAAADPRLLADRNYLNFAASRVLSAIAWQSLAMAMGWMMYDVTGSTFMLGMVGLAQFLPMALLTFVIGQVIDRYDRRRIGFICQAIETLTALVLVLLLWHGALPAWGILVAAALLGGVQAFERPTMAALLPNVVPAGLLQRAIAGSTSLQQSAMAIGPSLGGVLYGFGASVPFIVATVLFAIASVNVIAIRHATARPSGREPVTLQSLFAGIGFIRANPLILGTLSLDLFAVLLGGATALLPAFAKDILHAGPFASGLLRASPAIGALVVSAWLAFHPLKTGAGRKMLWAVGVFGLATLVFALSTNVFLSIAALMVAGGADVISVVVRSSLVQLLTPDAMRGRVNAVNSLFIGTSNQLGEFESGVLASLVGIVPACLLGGAGTIAIVLLWSRLFPQLRKVETLEG